MVAPLPVYRCTLTGACRVRRGWFGRVVMVVEVCVESLEPCAPERVKASWHEWRDVRLSDFELVAKAPATPGSLFAEAWRRRPHGPLVL